MLADELSGVAHAEANGHGSPVVSAYVRALARLLTAVDADALDRTVGLLHDARLANRAIFVREVVRWVTGHLLDVGEQTA